MDNNFTQIIRYRIGKIPRRFGILVVSVLVAIFIFLVYVLFFIAFDDYYSGNYTLATKNLSDTFTIPSVPVRVMNQLRVSDSIVLSIEPSRKPLKQYPAEIIGLNSTTIYCKLINRKESLLPATTLKDSIQLYYTIQHLKSNFYEEIVLK